MYLSIPYENFDINNIYISNKTINNIIEKSSFYRLMYSDEWVSTNGLYILLNLNLKNNYKKVKLLKRNNNNNYDTSNNDNQTNFDENQKLNILRNMKSINNIDYIHNYNEICDELINEIKIIIDTIYNKFNDNNDNDKKLSFNVNSFVKYNLNKIFETGKYYNYNKDVPIIIRFSGIYETENELGITCKFIEIDDIT